MKPEREPRDAPVSASLLGKDELNLAEFPLALVTDRIPAGQKTIKFEDRIHDEREGRLVTRRLIITASDEYGLPTAKDDEVILGLIQLTRQVNDFTDRTVRFDRSDLIRLLGWPDAGSSFRRLATSFHRWLGVSLHYENAWWDKERQRWTTLGFHIIEAFRLADGARGGRVEPTASRFTWNEDVFRSFRAGYLKRLDLGLYLSLEHPIAKRMYRFLDKRFYHRDRWEFDLKEFALDHIGLSRGYEGNVQLARKLRPAIEELEGRGFLEPMAPGERFRKVGAGRWRVAFARKASADAPEAPPAGDPAPLVAELIARGVTPATAGELAAAHPEADVRARVEVFDWLVAKGDGRVSRSPGGYLADSIRKGYAAPRGFVPAAERAARAEAERRREAEARAAKARERDERARVDAYWDDLSPEARARLEAEALAAADPTTRANCTTGPAAVRRMGLRAAREEHIRRLLGLPVPGPS